MDELLATADSLGIDLCWDFGHMNVNTFGGDNDQRDAIRRAGSRIKVLHVHDNCGGRPDEHLPPYLGSVDWDNTLPVLKEIGYKGNFNFEVLPTNIPGEKIEYFARYLVDIGKKFIKLCE